MSAKVFALAPADRVATASASQAVLALFVVVADHDQDKSWDILQLTPCALALLVLLVIQFVLLVVAASEASYLGILAYLLRRSRVSSE